MSKDHRIVLGMLRALSPRHRRWRQLVHSLQLDWSELERPLEEPGDSNFIICGFPRSGTSLLAAATYQPPRCVTVMEPWDGLRSAPVDLFRSLRVEIDTGVLQRGQMDPYALERGEVHRGRDGEFPHSVAVESDFLLGVKWPAYWRYLDLLPRTKFLVCVRNPVEVITSFARVGGRLRQGLDYDVPFNREMNGTLSALTDDIRIRRVLMYEYIASRIVPHLGDRNVFVVRYERWFFDRQRLMDDLSQFLGVALGPGRPIIRRPDNSQHEDPDLYGLIEVYCPAAVALGYGAGAGRSSVGP